MPTEQLLSCDGDALASSVRSLAEHAHRLLKDPAAGTREARDLARRIARLQRSLHGRPPDDPLSRWLEGLRHQVESLAPGCAAPR